MRRMLRTSCGLVGLLLLTACSSSEDDASPPSETSVESGASLEQLDIIEERLISRDDYEGGFLRYVACIEEFGGEIEYAIPPGEGIRYLVLEGADDDEACYDTHFALIDENWQLENPRNLQPMITQLIDCLIDAGIDPDHVDPSPNRGIEQENQLADLSNQETAAGLECPVVKDQHMEELYERLSNR